jgi:hypothetical protein
LADFPGRWTVFRTSDLAAGKEHAVLDVEPPHDHTVEDLAELESRAAFAVGEGHDATLVVTYLPRRTLAGDELTETQATPVLALAVWSLEHPVALTGDIKLNEAGTPVRIGLPDAVPRSRNHDRAGAKRSRWQSRVLHVPRPPWSERRAAAPDDRARIASRPAVDARQPDPVMLLKFSRSPPP